MSDSNYNRPRPITLTKLEDTDYYQLWCTTTKSTFDIHNVLNIVLGTEPKPTDANEAVLVDWDRRHKLAKEALLSALKPAQLLRVSHLKPTFDTEEYCEGCQKQGHTIEECPIKCNYCKERGHLVDNCYKSKWVNEQRFSKRENDNDDNGKINDRSTSGDREYRPSFIRR
jgi:hypothetical protein